MNMFNLLELSWHGAAGDMSASVTSAAAALFTSGMVTSVALTRP